MSAVVLRFPQTERALRNGRSPRVGAGAMGLLALQLRERDGEPMPENVHRFDGLDDEGIPDRSPALLLAALAFGGLPKKRQEAIKRSIRAFAFDDRHNKDAVQLHNLLNREGEQ